jgi:hypothetical protein
MAELNKQLGAWNKHGIYLDSFVLPFVITEDLYNAYKQQLESISKILHGKQDYSKKQQYF